MRSCFLYLSAQGRMKHTKQHSSVQGIYLNSLDNSKNGGSTLAILLVWSWKTLLFTQSRLQNFEDEQNSHHEIVRQQRCRLLAISCWYAKSLQLCWWASTSSMEECENIRVRKIINTVMPVGCRTASSRHVCTNGVRCGWFDLLIFSHYFWVWQLTLT